MADIVKYQNQLNCDIEHYPLWKLLEVEQDIFMVILSKTTFDSSQTVEINLYDVCDKIGYTRTSINDFERIANNLILKICNPKISLISDKKLVVFVCFDKLEYDRETKDLKVHIQDDFYAMVKNYQLGFTRFELAEFVSLSGNYTKTLYRLLKQWRTKGKWTVSINDFRRLLNIPDSYRMRDIDRQVLTPAINQLKAKMDMIDDATGKKRIRFSNLKVEKVLEKGKHRERRGRKIADLIFTWDRESTTKHKQKAEQPQLIQTTKPKPKRKKLQDEQGRPLAEGYRRDEDGNLVPDLLRS